MRFAIAATLALVAGPAAAADTLVRVNTFPTARSLPFFVGVEIGEDGAVDAEATRRLRPTA